MGITQVDTIRTNFEVGTDTLNPALDKLDANQKQVAASAGAFNRAASQLGNQLNSMVVGYLSVSSAVRLLSSSLEEAIGDRRGLQAASRAFEAAGISADISRPQIEAFAARIQDTTELMDDQARAALQSTAALTNGLGLSMAQIERMAELAIDVSAATGQSMEAINRGLARLAAGDADALKRLFPELSQQLGEMAEEGASVEEVFGLLEDRFGGLASEMDPAIAQLHELEEAWADVKGEIGEVLLGLGSIAVETAGAVEQANQRAADAFEALRDPVEESVASLNDYRRRLEDLQAAGMRGEVHLEAEAWEVVRDNLTAAYTQLHQYRDLLESIDAVAPEERMGPWEIWGMAPDAALPGNLDDDAGGGGGGRRPNRDAARIAERAARDVQRAEEQAFDKRLEAQQRFIDAAIRAEEELAERKAEIAESEIEMRIAVAEKAVEQQEALRIANDEEAKASEAKMQADIAGAAATVGAIGKALGMKSIEWGAESIAEGAAAAASFGFGDFWGGAQHTIASIGYAKAALEAGVGSSAGGGSGGGGAGGGVGSGPRVRPPSRPAVYDAPESAGFQPFALYVSLYPDERTAGKAMIGAANTAAGYNDGQKLSPRLMRRR